MVFAICRPDGTNADIGTTIGLLAGCTRTEEELNQAKRLWIGQSHVAKISVEGDRLRAFDAFLTQLSDKTYYRTNPTYKIRHLIVDSEVDDKMSALLVAVHADLCGYSLNLVIQRPGVESFQRITRIRQNTETKVNEAIRKYPATGESALRLALRGQYLFDPYEWQRDQSKAQIVRSMYDLVEKHAESLGVQVFHDPDIIEENASHAIMRGYRTTLKLAMENPNVDRISVLSGFLF